MQEENWGDVSQIVMMRFVRIGFRLFVDNLDGYDAVVTGFFFCNIR